MELVICFTVFLFIINFRVENVGCTVVKRDDILLPTIFNITDVDACPTGHFYCKIVVKLRPQDEQKPPEIWKAIEKVNTNVLNFGRDTIYRTVCVEGNVLGEEYSEYSNYGLVGWVDESYCFEKGLNVNISTYDICLGLGTLFYLMFLVYCNYQTFIQNKTNEKKYSERAYKYMRVFSVSNTWRDIKKRNEGEDFNKLLCIQGIRTITICLIILVHNSLAMILLFSHNPEYVEQFLSDSYTGLFVSSFCLLVQIFFIISAWLLSVQLNNIVKKNGKITIKDVLVISLNRYFRLIPAMIVILLMHSSPPLNTYVSPLLYRSFTQLELESCRNRWWANILFIQNWSCFGGQTCSPSTWYIAVDTQLYLMVLLFFYLSQKFRISIMYFFGVAAIVAIWLQGYTVMTTTFDGLLQFNPRVLAGDGTFTRPEFVYSYIRTVCNLVTYIIGFVFGSIYVENKHKDIFDTSIKKLLWFAAFFGLPLLPIFFYTYRSHRVIEALRAVTFRPLFALGVSIGILGMATNTGGFIKKFLEWRPLVFMGNFTYSVYMFHIPVVFARKFEKDMKYYSNFYYMKDSIEDLALSFLIGTIIYIILEHPCIQLQKMVLPQIKTMRNKTKVKDS